MRDITGAEEDVLRLFNPASIAVVGASARPGALSWWPLHLAATKGFAGAIYPINPTRDEIEGLRCYPSLGAVGQPIDLAVVALSADKVEDAIRQCADAGVRNVVLPTQGFGEVSEDGARRQEAIADFARARGMRIVGPNTDGIANLANGAIGSIQPLFEEGIASGPVGLVTQSGATASSLLLRLKQAGIGCRYYASAGNEIDLGLTDYMSVMVQDPDVRIILSFVESLRRPEEFGRVADMAAELGKPIVLIKVGRSEEGARRAAAHTGSLAGSDALYDALFASRGVIRVSELSEMVAVAKLFLTQGAPVAPGVGIISVSGGQAGALADKAAAMGLPVPAISAAAEARLNVALTFGKGFNPCDLTGEIATKPSLAVQVYQGFSGETGIGTIIYARKHLTANAGVAAGRMLGEAAKRPEATPLAIYAMDGTVWGEEAENYRADGVPVFDNLHDLYTATDRLAWWSSCRPRPRPEIASGADRGHRGTLPDDVAKAILGEAGVPMPGETFAADATAAVAAARAIGFPVVMKIVSQRIPHKTEAGGVALGLDSAAAVVAAFDRLMANARAFLGGGEADGVLVQEQIENAVEMIVGIKVDPALGPFVVVGLGGIFTELLKDVAIRPAPVSADEARAMVESLRGAAILGGFRGAPAADIAALAGLVADVSLLAIREAGWLAEADLNPVLVLEKGRGVRVVDALMVGRD
jgi:acyl-CoA synthetase (NDP forming)